MADRWKISEPAMPQKAETVSGLTELVSAAIRDGEDVHGKHFIGEVLDELCKG